MDFNGLYLKISQNYTINTCLDTLDYKFMFTV